MLSLFARKRLAVLFVFLTCTMAAAVKFGPAALARDTNAPLEPTMAATNADRQTDGPASPASSFAFIDSAAKVFGLQRNSVSPNFLPPTVLATGDIVFTGYHATGPTTATDQFVFVPLVDLDVGTVIKFTDNSWNGSFSATESVTTFTVTPSLIPAGTEIIIILGPPAQALNTTGGVVGTAVVAGPISLPSSGDQMFAYQGPDSVPTTIISGIHMNVESVCGTTTAAGWDPVACLGNNNSSTKPAALTTGTNAFWHTVEFDNGKFNGCGLTLTTPAQVRAAVNNPANWILEDQPGGSVASWYPTTWSGCTFLTAPPPPAAPEINVQGNGTNIFDASATPSAADHTSFGSTSVTGGTLMRTFTIQNQGTANLSVTGISFVGGNNGDFSVSGISFPATITPANSTTFIVTFDPSAAGIRSTTLNIANNDGNENPYDFAIQGSGYVVVPPTGTAPPLQWSSPVQNSNAGTTRTVGSTNSGDVIAGSRINSGSASDLRITRHVGGTGVLSWTRDITNGTNDDIGDMIVDPTNGDAYICANATAGVNSTDWFVIKVNGADGTVAWTRTHNGTLGTGADSCFDIARTSDGNVVAVGNTNTALGSFARAAKINASTGVEMWAFTSPTNLSQFSGVATDTFGNTYAVGIINAATADGVTVKLNSGGGADWTTIFNGTANLNDGLSHVVVDSSGNPIVGGTTRISDVPITNSDGIVIKYVAATGVETWRRLITGAALASETINNLVIDATGDLYAAGSIRNLSSSDRDAYVTKITGSSGASAWITTKFGSAPDSDDRYQNVRVVGTDVYAVGNIDGNNRDIIGSRFAASNGAEVWSTIYNGTGNGADDEFSNKHVMTTLGTDAIAIGGQTVVTGNFTHGIVLKYSVPTDLTATKTDTVGGTTPLGSTWDWRIDVANPGIGPSSFGTGQVILRDNLPNTNVGYGAPVISNQVGLSGTGTVSCSIASFNLTCTASGGAVNIAAAGGFRVTTTATPTAFGTFANPRAAGVCAVDPDLNIVETNEGNNACTGSVTVVGPPTIAKAFGPTTILQNNGFSTLTITFTNPNTMTALSGVGVVDNFPAGIQVDATPTATNSCGGTFAPAAAATSITLSGGSIIAGGSCEIGVRVRGTTAGAKNNTTNNVTSTNGGSGGTAAATLTVTNTATWNGSIDSNWNTAANWTPGAVPNSGNNVDLPSMGVMNQPNLSAGDTTVVNLAVGANRTLTIGGNRTLTINGTLTMNGLNVDATAGLIEIGGAGSVVRTSGVVLGPMRKVVTSAPIAPESPAFVFTYPVGTATGFSPVTADFTAGSGSLTVLAMDGTAPSTPALNDGTTLDRYWQLTETGDLTASLTFTYLQADVDGNEANYRMIRSVAGSPPVRFPNGCPGSPCVDGTSPTGGTIFVNPVTSFSNFWTAGEPLAPTAAGVSISGRVLTADGRGIRNARIVVTGNALVEPLYAQTGTFGYYTIEGLRAGETYVVTVNSRRFVFSTPSHVITVLDNVTALDFTASPE